MAVAKPKYEDILTQARQLNPREQLQLLEELAALVRRQMTPQPRRSIMELQGLGKEIWHDVDIEGYVDRERDSWNG